MQQTIFLSHISHSQNVRQPFGTKLQLMAALAVKGETMSKESKHVTKFRQSHLKPSEKVVAWGEGYIGEMMGSGDKTQHNGALIVTNERAAFYRKGILGEVLETIPLKKITSIERKSMMGHRTIRMHTSHDQLEFKTFEKDKEQEQELVNAIESGREESKRQNEQRAIPQSDVITDAKLQKIAELKLQVSA